MSSTMFLTVSAYEAYELVIQNKVVILDVREPYEFNSGHIRGAINIPWTQVDSLIDNVIPNKNTPILLHCLSGTRSQKALTYLLNHGYKNIYYMSCGIQGWRYELI